MTPLYSLSRRYYVYVCVDIFLKEVVNLRSGEIRKESEEPKERQK